MTRFTVETVEAQQAAVVRGEVPMDELPAFFDRAYHEVARVVEAQGLQITGAPFGFYPRMPDGTVAVAAGFPVSGRVTPDGPVTALELPGGRAIRGVHVGPYSTMAATYHELVGWAEAEGLELAGHMWESYLSDPSTEPDQARWQTLLTWPID